MYRVITDFSLARQETKISFVKSIILLKYICPVQTL